MEENQLVISKFKGKRRTETVTYPMQIIRNLNQQYLETLQKLLDNDGVLTPPKRNSIEIKTSQQPQEPESPKFGQSSKLREAGNDGVSPSWVLKKSPSVKYELKPYTLKEVLFAKLTPFSLLSTTDLMMPGFVSTKRSTTLRIISTSTQVGERS